MEQTNHSYGKQSTDPDPRYGAGARSIRIAAAGFTKRPSRGADLQSRSNSHHQHRVGHTRAADESDWPYCFYVLGDASRHGQSHAHLVLSRRYDWKRIPLPEASETDSSASDANARAGPRARARRGRSGARTGTGTGTCRTG